jgi:hypothetical protein
VSASLPTQAYISQPIDHSLMSETGLKLFNCFWRFS